MPNFNQLYERLPNVQNVAAGATATVEVPIGYTYDMLKLVYTTTAGALKTVATIKTDITGIRLKINGKIQREFSATQLFAINSFHGMSEDDGQIPLFFYEPWRNLKADGYAFAMGTADLTNRNVITLEVDVAGGAATPKLECFGLRRRDNRVMGQIVKMLKSTIQVAGTGYVDYFPPKSESYNALHAFSANIADIVVKADSKLLYDTIPLTNLNNILKTEGYVPQTNVVHVKFDLDQIPNSRLAIDNIGIDTAGNVVLKQELIKEFQVRFNMSSAANFEVIREVLGPRD